MAGKRNPKMKATYVLRAFFVILCGIAIIYVANSFFKVITGSSTENKSKRNKSEFSYDISEYEKANKQRQEDFENGEAAMGSDEPDVLDEDMVDSGDENIMCQDYYDNDGNLIWKGLTIEESNNADSETIKKYEDAMEKYNTATSEANENTELTIASEERLSNRIRNLCVEYDQSISYASNNFNYYLGYIKDAGYDNIPFIRQGQTGYGMCGIGYITWVYRNTLGITPTALKGKKLNKKKVTELKSKDVQIGDICVADSDEGNLYGVVCGEYKSKLVVSMCDSVSTENFPAGNNHMVYVESQSKQYIGNYAPVNFNKFYRLKEVAKETEKNED